MLQEVMSEFNKIQLEHRDHCKARIKRQLEICELIKDEMILK